MLLLWCVLCIREVCACYGHMIDHEFRDAVLEKLPVSHDHQMGPLDLSLVQRLLSLWVKQYTKVPENVWNMNCPE